MSNSQQIVPTAAQAQFIYNEDVNALIFDPDGTGAEAGVTVAFLNSNALTGNVLDESDFFFT